ncbi:MAG: hypothetical protein EBZ93_09595 [Actinobacteria bacterium]|nr:hypothetical protein [Actinomycetota bacterium]
MRGVGRHDHDRGERHDRAVPRTRDALDRPLRVGGQSSASHRESGERPQVLHSRRFRFGLPALRHRPSLRQDWRPVIWVLAVLSVVVGSVMAVVQTDVKRMLAYSSISHAGFIMIGIEAAGHAGDSDGLPAVLLYLVIYSVLVIGTFTVVTLVTRTGDAGSDIGSFRGLGRQRPALALAMTVFLLAQAGMPTTSGFIAKFGVITAAASNRSYAIAIIAMVASVIAAVLYLRIMISMWMADSESGDDARENVRVPATANVVIIAATVFTLVVGVFPGWLIDAARTAASFAG